MKTYIVLKLINRDAKGWEKTEALSDLLFRAGYSMMDSKGYAFKQARGQFDIVALSAFAIKHGMEAYVCQTKQAREIHGLAV